MVPVSGITASILFWGKVLCHFMNIFIEMNRGQVSLSERIVIKKVVTGQPGCGGHKKLSVKRHGNVPVN